jgi:hypothetical protein
MRNLIGWVWIAILSATRPKRTERVYHNTPLSIAGAESESLPGLPGTTGRSGDFDGS